MSDVEQEQAVEERTSLMSPQVRNLIVGTAIGIILLTITAWAGSVRTSKARNEALSDGIAALAASLKYPMLEARSMRTDAGRERLRPLTVDIMRAGGYKVVSISDPDGDVLATSATDLASSKFEEDELPKGKVKLESAAPGLRLYAPIMLGDTTLGYVVVETHD